MPSCFNWLVGLCGSSQRFNAHFVGEGRADVATARSAWRSMFPVPPTRQERLWYFPIMTTEPPPSAMRAAAAEVAAAQPPSDAPSLAVCHTRALYRPVPPVGYDDEGHPESDSATVESNTHGSLRTCAVGSLQIHYAAHPGFFAAPDMGLLFEHGNPAAVMAPDLPVRKDPIKVPG